MAEEEKKDYTESKNSFMDVLARGGEGIVDGLAKSNPVLGGALQAMVNTDEYKARKTAQEAQYLNNQVAIDDARFRLSDDYRNARSAQLRADTETANTKAMLANEDRSDFAVQERTTGRQAKIAQNNRIAKANELDMDAMDDQRHTQIVGNQQKNLENELSGNPMYNMMTFDEKRAFMQSPAIRNMLDASVYMQDVMGIAAGDKESFDRMDRLLNRQGFDLEQGKDGLMYLNMGNLGTFPVTKESVGLVNQMIHDSALEELQARSDISTTASLGDPARRNQAKYANALMPFNNNSAASSQKAVQAVYNNATDEQKTWTFFNQAIQDFGDPTVPTSAKMNELQACLPFLQSLGYSVEGFDPKAPSMDNLRIIKLEEGFLPGKTYSFSQFADLCKANDVISAQLDDMVERNARQFGRQQIITATQNVKDTAKAAKGEDQSEAEKQVQARQKHLEDFASAQLGAKYLSLSEDKREKAIELLDLFERNLEMNYLTGDKKDESDLDDKQLEDLVEAWKNDSKEIGLDGLPVPKLILNEIAKRKSEADAKAQKDKEIAENKKKLAEENRRNEAEQKFDSEKHGDELAKVLENEKKVSRQFGENEEQLQKRLAAAESNFKVAKLEEEREAQAEYAAKLRRQRKAEEEVRKARQNPASADNPGTAYYNFD